jgi:ribosome-binding protein aMBF1 (putative translation factor)
MSHFSSQSVTKVKLHASEIEKSLHVGLNKPMTETLKSLAFRLKTTREALNLSAAEICRQIKCKPNRWSQYESGERKIILDIAERLCNEFGLSLDWIYRGNPAMLPHAIRIKIRQVA